MMGINVRLFNQVNIFTHLFDINYDKEISSLSQPLVCEEDYNAHRKPNFISPSYLFSI